MKFYIRMIEIRIIKIQITGNALQLLSHWYSPCVVRLAVLVPTRVPLTLTKQVYSPSSSTPTLRIVKVGVVSPNTRLGITSSKPLSTSDPSSVLLHLYEMAGDPSALQLKVTLSPVVTVWSGMLSITEEKNIHHKYTRCRPNNLVSIELFILM